MKDKINDIVNRAKLCTLSSFNHVWQ